MTKEHNSKALKLSDGDSVEIVTTEGLSISGDVDKDQMFPKDPEATWQETIWNIDADDGETYQFIRLADYSGTKFTPVTRLSDEQRSEIPEEDQFGYIEEVEQVEVA